MQAMFDSRSIETFNNQWNFARTFNQARSISPFSESRASGQSSIYSQTPRGMTQSFNPYSSSLQRAGYGGVQRGAAMTHYEREISRTPNGMTMKTSFTSFQPAGSKGCNNVPDRFAPGSQKDWCDTDRGQNKVAPVVSQNGNKLNVDMANTHSELSKDKATTKVTVGGHDVELTGWGDPHGVLKVDGKESKADFSKPLSLDTQAMRVTMDPEKKQSGGGIPPHMDRVIFEPKGTSQVFVGEHLSPNDKSQVSFREVTDRREKADLKQVANNSQVAGASNNEIIDVKTGKKIV